MTEPKATMTRLCSCSVAPGGHITVSLSCPIHTVVEGDTWTIERLKEQLAAAEHERIENNWMLMAERDGLLTQLRTLRAGVMRVAVSLRATGRTPTHNTHATGSVALRRETLIEWADDLDALLVGGGGADTGEPQMSRSGYSEDCENVKLWRGAVDRATFGVRGQAFMRKLRDALDAMPVKRLIADAIQDESGQVCALGAVDPTFKGYEAEELAEHFKIARALAAEIVYMNDESPTAYRWERMDMPRETPEERWRRMRAWVAKQIGPEDSAGVDAQEKP